MKKIITSIGMIVFVAAVVVGGTGAFFSDTETSTGNVFTAGAIDLTIDSVSHYNGMVCTLVGQSYVWIPEANVTLDDVNQPVVGEEMNTPEEWAAFNLANPVQYPQAGVACTGTWPLADLGENELNVGTFFDFDDIKPGDEGENTISVHIDSNDAWMCVSLDNVDGADLEGTATEPEEEAGDVTFADALAASELDENLNFFAWVDDGDNIFEAEELPLGEATASELADETWALADSTTGNGPIAGGETQYIGLYWCAGDLTVSGTNLSCDGEAMGNIAQTDSWSADLSFYVEQSRNNEDFVCPGRVVELPNPILTLEKVVSQDGVNSVADSNWELTASGTVVVTGTDNDPNPSPAITNISVPAGDYTLTETGEVAGFTFQGINCTDGTLVGNVLTLAPGDNAVCTFTNVETNPEID